VKFLCVPCDQPMKLATLGPPDRGSLSVLYSCPACGYEMAMLTNPYETQIVQSLGVKVGGADAGPTAGGPAPGAAAASSGAGAGAANDAEAAPAGSRCPFAGMIGASDAAGAAAVEPGVAGAGAAPVASGAAEPTWTDTASERMNAIPAFVRPMARTGIERFARERGYGTIDEKVLEEARAFFGM